MDVVGRGIAIAWMAAFALCISTWTTAGGLRAAESASEIYARRIVPLLESGAKSSCTQCHLRGVELKDFLSADPAATFAQLRARGWIDERTPAKSKLLGFIDRHGATSDPLIEKVRAAELEAVRQWITAAVAEPDMMSRPLPPNKDLELPLEFIRHARMDRQLAGFADAIWSQLGRCVNCHSPDRNARVVKEHGDDVSWIVPGDPAATLKLLVDRKIIDIERPEESPLRTKPLVIVEHGGGPKFTVESETAQRWTAFLNDYAASVRRDGYQPGDKLPALPARRSWLSELQIKLTEVPAHFDNQLLQVSLHRLDAAGQPEAQATARADSTVNAKQHVWQQSLTVFVPAPKASEADWARPVTIAEAMPRGRYLVRVWARDLEAAALSSPTDVPRKIVTTFEIEGPWPPGYQPPKILRWKQ